MLPPSAIMRAELEGRLPLTSDIPGAETQKNTENGVSNDEKTSVVSTPASSHRLSRQGAIVRSRGPLPSPPSALSRATSTASRPVSFVNPRSSAAPLPRGRLPAITDATRHFPPSASSTGPGVAPSWLSYIPSEERERLPAPLEPQRVSRPPGGKVSAMISRFEAAPSSSRDQLEGSSSSPTKQSGLAASTLRTSDITRTDSMQSVKTEGGEGQGSSDGVGKSEPAVFRRFSRNEDEAVANGSVPQRRPPPPPPTLPAKRTDTNPFRRSQVADRPTSSGGELTQSTSMEALARQIDLAASEWSSASLDDYSRSLQTSHQDASGSSRLIVPSPGPSMIRSPRTQAMHTLTRREHEPGATTPPTLPPKSPITPEQILAAASRNGMSASIAAAQAAAFARRDRGGQSASSSVDAVQGARPLPELPRAVRGLGISGDGGRGELPRPPPLPVRPRDRDWDALGGVGAQQGSMDGRMVSSVTAGESRPTRSTCETGSSGQGAQNGSKDRNGDGAASTVAGLDSRDLDSSAGRATTSTTPRARVSTDNTSAEPSSSHPPSSVGQASAATPPPAEPSATTPPADPSTSHPCTARRRPSLGLTDFDLLVSQLDQPSSSTSNYEQLSLISEFLGPAQPVAATPLQLASLSVGMIECDSRRVTREGKIKQKLSCVGVRVDKCPICLTQFRENQRAVILDQCGHVLHEQCAKGLFRVDRRCPVCRATAV